MMENTKDSFYQRWNLSYLHFCGTYDYNTMATSDRFYSLTATIPQQTILHRNSQSTDEGKSILNITEDSVNSKQVMDKWWNFLLQSRWIFACSMSKLFPLFFFQFLSLANCQMSASWLTLELLKNNRKMHLLHWSVVGRRCCGLCGGGPSHCSWSWLHSHSPRNFLQWL